MDAVKICAELGQRLPYAFIGFGPLWDNEQQRCRPGITVSTAYGKACVLLPDDCSDEEAVAIVCEAPLPRGSSEPEPGPLALSPLIWARRAKQRLDEHLQFGNPYDG